jgi:APA family basic amino acid/polyamine antiporter
MFPNAGAEHEYTRQVFPPLVSFVVGWTMAGGLMVAAAAIAVGFAHYVQHFVDAPLVPVAIALLGAEAAIALTGMRSSARLTVMLSGIQVAGLLFIVAVGVPHLGSHSLVAGATVDGVLGGAALVFFAFIGFDEVITLAEETANPTRVVPRALLAALGISTLLYVAVAVAAVSVVGPDALASSSRPLADVAAHVLGGRAESLVAAVALVSTVNTSLLALTAGSRILYGMADVGALPRPLATVSRRTGAPVSAVLAAAAGASAFALIGELGLVASVTDFAVYVVFLAVNATVIILRVRRPDAERPFRVPLAVRRVPVVPLAGAAATMVMMPELPGRALLYGVAMVAVGAAVHLVLRRWPQASSSSPDSAADA